MAENGQHPDGFVIPEWVALLVGRLLLETEALRQALIATATQQAADSPGVDAAAAVQNPRG